MSAPPLPVALYVRISEDPLHLRAGVTRQLHDGSQISNTRWPDHPTITFEDNDRSASRYSRKPRPAFTELCAAISHHSLHAVVGWDFDRLFRQPRELESFLDLCDTHRFTRVVTAQGDVDLTTNDGRLQARILVAVSAKASDDTSRRVRRANQDRRERGLHDGRGTPFGYRLPNGVPIIVPASAAVVRSWARAALRGTPLAEIARAAPPDAPQTASGVRKLLLNPTLAGLNHARVRGTWTPILTDAQHAGLRALLNDPARRTAGPRGRRVWWLSGLVGCKCGGPMKVAVNGQGRTSYVCYRGCNGTAINARRLTTHMELELFAAVEAMEPDSQPAMGRGECGQLDAVDERLAQLATDYATGAITRAEWTAARDAITNLQLIHDPPPSPLRVVPDLAARWDTWTPVEQHHQAARVIERVVIHPAPVPGHWSPSRIETHWRV